MSTAPQTLPANFNGWDAPAAKPSAPPATLPANFSGWDADKTAQPALADQAHAEMSAKPTGAKQWLTDLESDLRYGGEQTVVGRALKAAGYQGAESLGGMEGTAGKTLVSPLTGPVFAAHGVAEAASGHPLRGAGEVLSGIGEASQIPMAFAAPETAEAAAPIAGKVGQTGLAVAKAAAKGADIVSFNRLSKVLDAMRQGAGDISDIWRGNTGAADTAAKITRFTAADRQAATELLHDATSRVVDQAVPPTSGASALTKSRIDYFLNKGDVANAEAALDQGAKQANPAWQPLQRQVVPSTNEIRARVQAESIAPKVGSYADLKDDNQVLDSVRNDFQRHEWAAASEARREFIARNSTGMTKGELASRFAATSGNGVPAAAPAMPDDLTEVLQKSLDAVRARQQAK